MPPELSAIVSSLAKRYREQQYMPPALRNFLQSPFVRDTLVPWFGVDPEVRVDPTLQPAILGEMNSRRRVSVNPGYFSGDPNYPSSGRDLPGVLAHEFAHAARYTPGNPILDTHAAYARDLSWQDLAGVGRTAGLPISNPTEEEFRAYTVEVAMRHIRAGARSKEDVPEDVRRRIPGFDLMFDWLQSRARQVEFERRFGRPLPSPEVRDSVRMRITP